MVRKEDLAIREEAKHFSMETVFPLVQALEDRHTECKTLFRLAAQHGYCGLGTAKELGGKGYNHLQSVLAYEGLAYGDSAFAVVVQLHNNITEMVESVASTEALRTIVRQMSAGEKLSSFALTEASAGSDPGANRGVARKESDGYHLFGEKMWVTAGTEADLIFTFLRKEGEKGMYLFQVTPDAQGVSVSPMDSLLYGNMAGLASITYDNCVVSESMMLTERGYQLALRTIDIARIFVPALCVGLAQRAVDECASYLYQRNSMGSTILEKESIQWQLADLNAKIEAARQLLYCSAETLDAGEPFSILAAKNKLFAPAVALEAVNVCVQLHGAAGLYRTGFPARALMCSKLFSLMDGTSEIQKVILGRNLYKETKDTFAQ